MLSGSNQVAGSAGYAGVYVAVGATLTISGDGSLNAKGGDGSKLTNFDGFGSQRIYWGGGAGIGGGDNGGVTSITICGGHWHRQGPQVAAHGGSEDSGAGRRRSGSRVQLLLCRRSGRLVDASACEGAAHSHACSQRHSQPCSRVTPTPVPVDPGKVPPRTGDSTPLFLLAALLLLNGAVLVISLKKKKRV